MYDGVVASWVPVSLRLHSDTAQKLLHGANGARWWETITRSRMSLVSENAVPETGPEQLLSANDCSVRRDKGRNKLMQFRAILRGLS